MYKYKKPLKPGAHGKAVVPDAVPYSPPVFDPKTQLGEAKAYLQEHGYVVYDVLDQQQISKAISLLWDFLEGLGTGILRGDPATWKTENWLPDGNKGILYSDGIGQSRFLWYLRGIPVLAEIFANLWDCQIADLLTSFDGCCIMRPISYNPDWLTQGGWYHVDQNGATKPGLHCYQGLVNLLDAGETAPGLVVCPGSQHKFDSYFKENIGAGYVGDNLKGDFVLIKPNVLNDYFKVRPIKLCVPAGTFVVWDSRTIHCNNPAKPQLGNPFTRAAANAKDEVVPDRIVAYVCMLPRPEYDYKLFPLLKDRRNGIRQGITTNHWPNKFEPARKAPPRIAPSTPLNVQYVDITPELNSHCRRLAGLDDK